MSHLDQLRDLPVSERIQLVEDLWDTIAQSPQEIRLSDVQKAELDRRIERLERFPDEGKDWSELKTRILNSL